MNNEYKVEETFKTPSINGDISKGFFHIKGKSLPEDAKTFYLPFRTWLQAFYDSASPNIHAVIELEYYNTATSKVIINLLFKLNELKATKNVQIEWRYEEDDIEMEETGLDFQNLLGDVLIMKPIKEENINK